MIDTERIRLLGRANKVTAEIYGGKGSEKYAYLCDEGNNNGMK